MVFLSREEGRLCFIFTSEEDFRKKDLKNGLAANKSIIA